MCLIPVKVFHIDFRLKNADLTKLYSNEMNSDEAKYMIGDFVRCMSLANPLLEKPLHKVRKLFIMNKTPR